MRTIVNHLTRMQPGYICVAGVDVSNGQNVRPVLRGRLATDLLVSKGGPFDMAALVELGTVKYCGHAPEIEDYYFDPRTAHYVRLVPLRFSGNCFSTSRGTALHRYLGRPLDRLDAGV